MHHVPVAAVVRTHAVEIQVGRLISVLFFIATLANRHKSYFQQQARNPAPNLPVEMVQVAIKIKEYFGADNMSDTACIISFMVHRANVVLFRSE